MNKNLKALITLSIPTIIEQVLSTLLQYVDTAMVGQLGEQATAAVSVTTTITWLVNSVASAVSVAFLAMISKAFGSKKYQHLKDISKHVVAAVLLFGIGLGILSMVLSPYIPIWMGAEKKVQKPASIYFFIISIPLVFRTCSTISGAAIRATQDTKTPMLISLCSNLLNVVLNLLLIYGCRLGVTGAAIASAISYTAAGILMYLAYRKNQWLTWERESFCLKPDIIKEITRLSIPVLGTNIVSCLGYVVFAGMVSGMGTTIFAAHSIAVTAETIFYIPGYGLRTATSAMVGLAYGERDREKFDSVCRLSVLLAVGMMFVSGLVLYQIAFLLMKMFTSSGQVAEIGAKMLKIVAFSEPFYGLMVVLEGIFYGLGRTGYAFFVEAFSMWGVRILFTFLCVQKWNLGLEYVWYCMIADNICKAILLSIPFLTKQIGKKYEDY